MGLVLLQQARDSGGDAPHRWSVPFRLRVKRRIARGKQQRVALAQRHLERLGDVSKPLARRHAATALYKTQMALRDACRQRKVELTPSADRTVPDSLIDINRCISVTKA